MNDDVIAANNPFLTGEAELDAVVRDLAPKKKVGRPSTAALILGDTEEDDIRRAYAKNKPAGSLILAEYMVRRHDIITVGDKQYEMYVYKDGKYELGLNDIIFPDIQRVLEGQTTQSAKMETYYKIASMTMAKRDIFASASLDLIPLENGVYDCESRKLLPHSPEYRFTYQLPISYDPAGTCPKTEAFLDQILSPEQRLLVEEWIGYLFLRTYMFKKAIIFVGEGDTGKTTLLEVITHLVGLQNISSVSLQKMTGDKFAAAHLFEKHANLVDELSARDISDTGNFKIATGGGTISGEYKFGNQFAFNNFSKLTFACNKIPDVKDFDDIAYFNRWMVVRFEKTIAKKIPNFVASLKTEEEKSGLFNLAMRGLDRLLEQGAFSYGKDAMDTKREMMRSGSSIASFCADALEQDLGNELSKEDLYNSYCAYCLEKSLAAETIKMVGTKLPFYVPYVSEGLLTSRYTKGGTQERARGWRNVRVRGVIAPEDIPAEMNF